MTMFLQECVIVSTFKIGGISVIFRIQNVEDGFLSNVNASIDSEYQYNKDKLSLFKNRHEWKKTGQAFSHQWDTKRTNKKEVYCLSSFYLLLLWYIVLELKCCIIQ